MTNLRGQPKQTLYANLQIRPGDLDDQQVIHLTTTSTSFNWIPNHFQIAEATLWSMGLQEDRMEKRKRI